MSLKVKDNREMTKQLNNETNERKGALRKILYKARRRKRLMQVTTVLGCLVVFCTTYSLILPAVTIDRDRAVEMPGLEMEKQTKNENNLENQNINDNELNFELVKDGALLQIAPEEGEEEETRIAVVVETDAEKESEASVFVLEKDPETGVQITEVALDDPAVSMLTPEEAAQVEGLEKEVLALVQAAEEEEILEPEALETLEGDVQESLEELGVNTDVILSEAKDLEEDSSAAPQNDNEDQSPQTDNEAQAPQTDDNVILSEAKDLEEDSLAAPQNDNEVPTNAAEAVTTGTSDIIASILNGTILQQTVDGVTVTARWDEGILPEGTEMSVKAVEAEEYKDLVDETLGVVEAETQSLDITFLSGGKEIEPEGDVHVTFRADFIESSASPEVVHIKSDGTAEVMDTQIVNDEISLVTDQFSVYVIRYTVDFHWEANGQEYDYGFIGGSYITMETLVEALGIGEGDASAFVAGIENMEFSDPSLIWVGKAEEDTTVGALKEANGLECEYSAELTEEEIEEINGQTVAAGTWALISLKPFDTDETLTVTMKNGDQFVVKVTDAQANPFGLDGNQYSIFGINKDNHNSYGLLNQANNDGSLRATTNASDASSWTFEYTGEGKLYLVHDSNNNYIIVDNNGVRLTTNREEAEANPILVHSKEGKYAFTDASGANGINIYSSGRFGRWDFGDGSDANFWLTLQSPTDKSKPGTITTADTSGVLQISLFDYGPEDQLDKEANNNTNPYNGGINSGHTLKFFSYGKNVGNGINDFTGAGNGPQTGIVADQLSGNYPVVASNTSESLNYLFGGVSNSYVTPYTNLNHLFTLDEEGYYHYDSNDNYAYLDGTDFKVYSKTFPEEGADEQYFGVGFFPFNDYDEYYNCIHGKDGFEYWGPHNNGTNKAGHYNHHFGMSLAGNFIMPPDGQYNGKDVTFQFSGDDDMWVFVDGILIMDIGGVHNPVHGEINFTTGEVTVHGTAQENFKEKYKRLTGNDWDDSDFSNHDFRVFYMERGGMYSNLEVTFNLPLTPEAETNNFQFDKVSSENESLKLSGAEFSLFNDPACSDPFTLASVPVKATSDDHGVVSFKNIPHGKYFMKETVYPGGYQAKTPEEIFTVVVDASGGRITSSSGDSVSQIKNEPKKIDVEVEKIWSNGIVPDGAEIEIVLGRYKLIEDPNAPGFATLVIKDSYAGLPSGSNYHVIYTITGPDGYSKTITASYTDSSKQIEESVEVPAAVAGSQYTVTKQVQNISYHNINNQNQTVNVTVSKNGTGQARFDQSTFTQNAYRVRIYAVNNSDPNNLYSENYYPAGSNLSVRIDHNAYNWGFFNFTVSSNTGWNSSPYTYDSQQQFTSNLNQDIDLILHCNDSSWTKDYNWIKDPYITGATPVQTASTGRMMMATRSEAPVQKMSQTASTPTLPDPPLNTLYVLDEDYSANPDKIVLSGGTWTSKIENLPAWNEYGPYVYYIAAVNESGMPDGTEITITNEVTLDGATQVLTVTNTVPQTVEINVLKVDNSDGTTPLTGAKFVLKRYNEGYHEVEKTWPEKTVSSEEGKEGTLSFDGLTAGYYELEETVSPDGYIRASAFPRFEVAVNPTTKELEVNFTDNTGGIVSYNSTNSEFIVRNEPGAALPNTGGPGTEGYLALGALMVVGAGMLLIRRKLKKQQVIPKE